MARFHVAAAGLIVAFAPLSARALPNFARREGVGCALCHSTIPRLNRLGYEYQNAGYRMPGQSGAPSDPEFTDLNTARVETGVSWFRSSDAAGATLTQSDINVIQATLFPATGSFGKYWSSRMELSL